jgi:hypothetical protein
MDINDNIPSYQICIPNIVQIQCIDTSKEMIKKALEGCLTKTDAQGMSFVKEIP